MKKLLTRDKARIYHYVDGLLKEGPHDRLSGDVSGLIGNVDDCELTEEDRNKGVAIAELESK